jgi:hypothetical protein
MYPKSATTTSEEFAFKGIMINGCINSILYLKTVVSRQSNEKRNNELKRKCE